MRVIRACRELGIASVAVYSEADRDALHVRLADEAYPIGPAPVARVLPAHRPRARGGARERAPTPSTPATASWPRTRPSRAPARRPGSSFIGPRSETIALMGEKTSARRAGRGGRACRWCRARSSRSRTPRPSRARGRAHRLPGDAEGGGGRRRQGPAAGGAPRTSWTRAAGARAQRGASAFGDDSVYLEKAHRCGRATSRSRSWPTRHGNAVHLFERECSIQRRHQKVVEESPSPLRHPRAARAHGRAGAWRSCAASGYRQRGHARVPGGRRTRSPTSWR